MSALVSARPQADVDTVATPPPPPRRPEPVADPRWDAALVELLSNLEHARTTLPPRAAAAAVLGVAEAMVAAAERLTAATDFPTKLAAEQGEAVARAGAFFVAAQEARAAVPGGVFRSVRAAFARPAASPGPAVRAALHSAADALAAYFALFTQRFPSSAAGRWWVTAASSFLADFRQQARDLQD